MVLTRSPLGQSGLRVSPMGLGTVKFGRNQQVKYPKPFDLPDDKTILTLLDQAKSLGVNLLDTAPAYGSSESRLGNLLNPKDEWVICTKVGEVFDNGQSRYDFSPEFTQASIEQSLKRLKREVLDIVLVHSNGEDLAAIAQGALDKLVELKQRGWIRAVGFSGKTVQGGLAALDKSDVIMVTRNAHYQDEDAVIDAAQNQQKGVLIKKALGSGHLPPEQSLKVVFSHPGVNAAILGTLSVDHMHNNAIAVSQALQ